MKHRIVAVFLILLVSVCYLSSANAKVITSAGSAHASDYTSNAALIQKLTNVFEGNIALYSDASCSNKIAAPLGNTSACYPGVNRYAGKSGYKVQGQSCWVYANAVYYTLFGDLPFNGGTEFLKNSRVYKTAFTASYSSFISNGVPQRPGTYVRTDSHSYIILGYNSEYIYYVDANYDGAGKVGLHILGWSGLPSICKSIKYYTTPNDSYFNSLYGQSAYELDVNFTYNGQEVFPDFSVITFNVSIGNDEYYGYSDWYSPDFYPNGIAKGTYYEVWGITPQAGYRLASTSGNLSGSIESDTVVWINLEDLTQCELDINFIVDGQECTETYNKVSFDIQVGDNIYTDCYDFWSTEIAPGSWYNIYNIYGKPGYIFTGYSGNLSGNLYEAQTTIWIYLDTCSHYIINEEVIEEKGCTWQKIYRSCAICGQFIETTSRGELNHDWVDVPRVAPTCTQPGQQALTYCTRCDFRVGGEEIPARGHTVVTDASVPATCIASGLSEGSHCSVCGTVLVEQTIIPAAGIYGHNWVKISSEHFEPTCTSDGYDYHVDECTYCHLQEGYVNNIVSAYGHTTVIDSAVVATCTEAGLTEGSHCSVCGVVLAEQSTVPALGHSAGGWVTVIESTTTEKGLREKRCTRCNTVLETEEIPVISGGDDIPAPNVQTINAKKGETVTLGVYINANNASMVTLRCIWDTSIFEFIGSECNEGQSMNGTFSIYSLTNTINGKIGTITLKIKEGVAEGTYSVTVNVTEAYDIDENPIPCKAALDKVKVSSRIPGDVTGDGAVDGRDLLRLAKYLGGYDVSIVSENATVNGDSVVDGRDLLRLAKYLGGYSVELQ